MPDRSSGPEEHALSTPSTPQRREFPVPTRAVVLISGTGSLLQALLDAGDGFPVQTVAVGADRTGIEGLTRAGRAGVPSFVAARRDHADRESWNTALADEVLSHRPDLVISAGFMSVLSAGFLHRVAAPVLNTHPALLPAFPGAHPVRDALAHGVKITGCTLHLVDAGVDTGPVVAQRAVPVRPGDTEETLHERIKVEERRQLVDTVAEMVTRGVTVTGRKVSIP